MHQLSLVGCTFVLKLLQLALINSLSLPFSLLRCLYVGLVIKLHALVTLPAGGQVLLITHHNLPLERVSVLKWLLQQYTSCNFIANGTVLWNRQSHGDYRQRGK